MVDKNIKNLILFFIITIFVVYSDSSNARSGKIKIDKSLKVELNHILKATSELHGACFNKNEPLIATKLKGLETRIIRAKSSPSLYAGHVQHIVKTLNSIKETVEMSQIQNGKYREQSLKLTFEKVAQLAKVYNLDKYRIFFCSKDKSTWIQKGWKAKNPVHPEKFKNCGTLVR